MSEDRPLAPSLQVLQCNWVLPPKVTDFLTAPCPEGLWRAQVQSSPFPRCVSDLKG